MNLETELAVAGYNKIPSDFNAMLIERLIADFPGRNIDSLVCVPTDAVRYATLIQQQTGAAKLPEYVILKALMNIRRRKDCPRGLMPLRRRILRTWLRRLGVSMQASQFRELCFDSLADMYKSQTIDELVCHPNEAVELCKYVRRRGQCNLFTDEIILTTLMNLRKESRRMSATRHKA